MSNLKKLTWSKFKLYECILKPSRRLSLSFINMSFISRHLHRSFATSASMSVIKHVTIIGGGLMGSGIAQVMIASYT